jgi:hypothetical protein
LRVQDISEADMANTCVVAWGWAQVGVASGTLQMRIFDALSGGLVADGNSKATAWWTASGAVKQLVKRAFDQTGLTQYSAEQHRKNMELLFPTRPKLDFWEKSFHDHPPTSDLEGLWSDEKGLYTVAITKAPPTVDFDYVGVVVSTNSPVWSRGEIKMEFKKTAGSGAFIGNYYPASKKRSGTIYTLEGGGILKFSFPGPNGERVRVLREVLALSEDV